jgi:hypothetical protein
MDMTNPNIRKIITTEFMLITVTQFFAYLLLVFTLKMLDSNTNNEDKNPGIDLKEFR